MTTQRIKRKLAAVLHMDVTGYSRLMGEDEVGTLSRLTTYRDVLYGMVELHGGRVVDTAGDAFLVEFASVVDAISCAVEFQNEIRARNEEVPEDRRMAFRIGINVGDVIEDEDNIYGDGVNIAARLEALAEPGGICISGTAYDQLKRKLSLDYEFMGEKSVKNIAEPVRTYRVRLGSQPSETESEVPAPVVTRSRSLPAFVAIGVAVLIVGGVLGWWFLQRPASQAPASHTPRPGSSTGLGTSSSPAVVVLPFTDASGAADRQHIGAGFSRALAQTLCRIQGVDVIAARSTEAVAGKSQDMKAVAKKLAASHIVFGTIRTEGERLLVSVEMNKAGAAAVWSRQYDRSVSDMFVLQSEVALELLASMGVSLSDSQKKLITDKSPPTRNPEAYDAYLRAMSHEDRARDNGSSRAEALLEQAVALDPQYAEAYAALGRSYLEKARLGRAKMPLLAFVQAENYTRKALALDDSVAAAHETMAFIYLRKRKFDLAVSEAQKAASLVPGDADVLACKGTVLVFSGHSADAIPLMTRAMRLNPLPQAFYFRALGDAYTGQSRYADAIRTYLDGVSKYPLDPSLRLRLTVAYVFSGKSEEARHSAAELLRIRPAFSLIQAAAQMPVRNAEDAERIMQALRSAGLK